MGELTKFVSKKDYIFKSLSLPGKLSTRDVEAYIALHLPKLYPGELDNSRIGFYVDKRIIYLFLLQTDEYEADRRELVVPCLLMSEKQQTASELFFLYEEGYEKVVYEEGQIKKITWHGYLEEQRRVSEHSRCINVSAIDFHRFRNCDIRAIGELLPKNAKQIPTPFYHTTSLSRSFKIRFALYGLLAAVLIGLTVHHISVTEELRRSSAESTIKILSSQVQKLAEYNDQASNVQLSLEALETVEEYSGYRFLQEVYGHLKQADSRAMITDIRFSRGEFTVSGMTFSGLQVFRVFDESSSFSDVKLVTRPVQREGISASMEGFSISGDYSGELR